MASENFDYGSSSRPGWYRRKGETLVEWMDRIDNAGIAPLRIKLVEVEKVVFVEGDAIRAHGMGVEI